jgi:hypothetical protein
MHIRDWYNEKDLGKLVTWGSSICLNKQIDNKQSLKNNSESNLVFDYKMYVTRKINSQRPCPLCYERKRVKKRG